MKIHLYKALIAVLVLCTISLQSMAQEELKPRPSPLSMVTMKYKNSYVKVTYGRPHKKGREIFGALVPYGQVWRTGANEATEITLTADMMIGKDKLEAGTYTIFTIPGKERWTVIFNKDLGQWGAYNYNEKADAVRIEVLSQQDDKNLWEPFTIEFDQSNSQANMLMMWERTKISVPINFIK